MNRLRRRVNAAANPWSTAASRWWCRSALRHLLTGYGPTARQRRLMSRQAPGIRRGAPDAGVTPSAELTAEQMRARVRAIDDLLGRPDR
jgi:hypothetical protein